MNKNQLYIPNHEKWVKYYEKLGTTEHPIYFRPGNRKLLGKMGGSIGKRGEKRIIPIENATHKVSTDASKLKVELVSPVQQVVEQAASEINREKNIKRKSSPSKNQSTKRTRRKKSTLAFENGGNQF